MTVSSPALSRLFSIVFGISLAASGCAAAPAASAPPRPSPPATASSEGPSAGVGRVRSRSLAFPVELLLPAKDEWQLSERSWLVATHAATHSELALRTWRADRLVKRDECLAQARLARATLPVVREEAVLERRAFASPKGLDSELVVGVEPTEQGVSGYALVIGSSVGLCYAAAYVTQASGARAEQEIATRLGIAADRVLQSVRIRAVDERAVRRRLVVTSPGSARQ